MAALLSFWKPAPYREMIQDPEEVSEQYRYWRWRTFYSIFTGYAFYYFTRKSLTYAMPILINDMGYTTSELGFLASVLSISYGISKFVSGVLADKSNPRVIMSFGLIITGLINVFFGLSSSLWIFALLWGFNGWFQGFGAPPCTRYLTHWYSHKERGRRWAVWNTAHNIGGALIPIIAGYSAQYFGWRGAMYIPGILCIIMGFWLLNRLRDTPQSLGLPSIERFKNDYTHKDQLKEEHEKELPVREILSKYVLRNKILWILAFAQLSVYITRTAITDWSGLYLCDTRGYSVGTAGACLFNFEFGGIFGALAAGWMSDKIYGGRRGPVNVLYAIGIVAAISCFIWIPTSTAWSDSISMFAIGFFIYGPQMLVGMAAAELSHKKAAATTSGLTGLFGYIGAAIAGYPLGLFIESYGWQSSFALILSCSLLTVLLLIPTWRAGGRIPVEVEAQTA